MLQDSTGTPSKRGTPSRKPASASAPGTPAKTPKQQSKVKSIDMSDDESPDGAVVNVAPKSTNQSYGTSSTTRRRSEIDRLKIDNPGPQMAQAVPPSEEGIRTRSRRTVGDAVPASSKAEGTELPAVKVADNRQWMIMLVVFVVIAISVVFAMRFGLPAKLQQAPRTN